jgi:pyridoxine kinase
MNLLSIQSHVVYGHVGNSAAVFPLQRIGIEVWPVDTVQYSNHTGYEDWRGRNFSESTLRAVVEGVEERGILGECDGVLSGYLPSAEVGDVVLEAVGRVKSANPAAQYCCDPVIGDLGRGVFVRRGVPEFIRDQLLPIADNVTPNPFELEQLTGHKIVTRADALGAIETLHARGPRVVLLTSLTVKETPDDSVDLLASDGVVRLQLRTPRLPVAVSGAGDLIAALFFAHFLREGSLAEALSRAASSMFGVLSRTAEEGAGEMLLVAAQEELVKPTQVFRARPIGE